MNVTQPSRVAPIITNTKTLKRHLTGLPCFTKHCIINAVAQGTNGRIKLIKANARGYRSFAQYRLAFLFHCGGLDRYPKGCVL